MSETRRLEVAGDSGAMADRAAADTDAVPRALIPDDIAELLGPRPLLSGESAERYDAMFARFIVEFEPDGVIEWVLLRDVHDLTWEIQRVRVLIASLVDSSRGEALALIGALTSTWSRFCALPANTKL